MFPMASPLFFIDKKDGSLCPCQDYRYLNKGTVKNIYPLPLVQTLIDKLHKSTISTKLDLRSGYNNVRIKDGNQWKAAFKCEWGLFEPTVMFFGLCNSPATFQAFMDDIFNNMLDEGWLVIYMDNILIFFKDTTTHRESTRWVLQCLQENNLYLKTEKCAFEVTETEYLELIIHPDVVTMDPAKLKTILNWSASTSVKGVRSFLGFSNFYQWFISYYSDTAWSLHDLTKKDTPWHWEHSEQNAFNTLKKQFTKVPVLLMSDKAKAFTVESDALKFATGAVLW